MNVVFKILKILTLGLKINQITRRGPTIFLTFSCDSFEHNTLHDILLLHQYPTTVSNPFYKKLEKKKEYFYLTRLFLYNQAMMLNDISNYLLLVFHEIRYNCFYGKKPIHHVSLFCYFFSLSTSFISFIHFFLIILDTLILY